MEFLTLGLLDCKRVELYAFIHDDESLKPIL